MRRLGFRIALMLLLIAFGIFFGVDMATKGTERIHGPLSAQETVPSPDTPSSEQSAERAEQVEEAAENEEAKEARQEEQVVLVEQSNLPKWIGQTLQSIAQKGIEWIVSLFELFL